MFDMFCRLSSTHKALISLSVGIVLLLYALNVLHYGFDLIIIALACYCILMGVVALGWHKNIIAMLRRAKKE